MKERMHSQSNPNVSVDCVVFGFDGGRFESAFGRA